MEWEYEEFAGIVGEDRSFDYEGGDDGEDSASAARREGWEGALAGWSGCHGEYQGGEESNKQDCRRRVVVLCTIDEVESGERSRVYRP